MGPTPHTWLRSRLRSTDTQLEHIMSLLSRWSPTTLGAVLLMVGCADLSESLVAPSTKGPSLSVNVTGYGAIPNDGLDDSEAIKNALQANTVVRIPSGNFDVHKEIPIPSGRRLYGDDTSAVLVIKSGFPDSAALSVRYASDVTVERIKFQGTGQNTYLTGLRVANGTNVTLQHSVARGVGLISTSGDYHSMPRLAGDQQPAASTLSNNIKVLHNIAVGPGSSQWGGISVEFTNTAEITGNTVRNYGNGINWNGGNAEQEGFVNQYYHAARHYVIKDNVVEDIYHSAAGQGGCIWGSMGYDIYVWRNRVARCADVGLDAEGSISVTFFENHAEDTEDAVLAVFFYSKDVHFKWNSVYQYGVGGNAPGKRTLMFNTTGGNGAGTTGIQLHNNRFFYVPGAGAPNHGRIEKQDLGSNIEFINNEVWNSRLRFSSGSVSVWGNTFNFDKGDIGADAVCVGHVSPNQGNFARVYSNTVTSTGTSGQAGAAFNVYPHSGNPSGDITVTNNTVSGFQKALWLNTFWSSATPNTSGNNFNGGAVSEGSHGEIAPSGWCTPRNWN